MALFKRYPLFTALVIMLSLLGALTVSMTPSKAAPASERPDALVMVALSTPLVQLEMQAAERAVMIAAAADPVPTYVPPPAEYTVQGSDADGLTAAATRLAGSHPELLAKAANYPDYFWSCNKDKIPNPNIIRVGQVLRVSCDIAPDQVTPISSWAPPAPPAPPATPEIVTAAASQPATQPVAETTQAASAPAPSGVHHPCPGCRVSSTFQDPTRSDNHLGADMSMRRSGDPVFAALGGTVVEAGPASGFGQWVVVKQDDGTTAVYGHVVPSVWSGRVEAGQVVAHIADMSGCPGCSGPHLHFEIHPDDWAKGSQLDPVQWLRAHGVAI